MNSNIKRLGIIAGIILAAFALGYISGHLSLVIAIFKAILLILFSITILVTVHELGHFLAAKAFGMRVEIFSIGFPPKLFSFRRGETDYQIGATPLGGYVKIAGMIDESMDKEVIQREKAREEAEKGSTQTHNYGPRPWEFRAKPVWQRLIVMLAGVIMNVILGIAIFSSLKLVYGETRTPVSEIVGGIIIPEDTTSLGSLIGLKTGDEILSYKGKKFDYIEEYIQQDLLINDKAWFEVEREGEKIRIDVPPYIQNYLGEDTIFPYIFTYRPTSHIRVFEKPKRSQTGELVGPAAFRAGLRTGDRIVQLGDSSISFFEDIYNYRLGRANQAIQTHYIRAGDTLATVIQLDSTGYLGVGPYTERVEFDPWTALVAGTQRAFRLVSTNAQGFANIAKKDVKASKSLMGLPQIAWRFVSIWEERGIPGFLEFTAALSMILAFVNILPIPALDGGHVVFLLIEGITRREPSVKVRLVAQQIGLLLILGLMLYVIFNDIIQMAT